MSARVEASEAGVGTVPVTGGPGSVGSWCISELVAHGHRARATVRGGVLESIPAARLAAYDGALEVIDARRCSQPA